MDKWPWQFEVWRDAIRDVTGDIVRDLGCLVCLLLPLLCFLSPGVANDRVLAMRDGSHYYYPLWQWVHEQWRSGHVPTWNPHEQGGVSLAGDPTACLWYPGHLLFALASEFRTGYHAFLAAHLILASWGAYRAARCGGASRIAALIAGLAYGYGAPVLFLYSNPIYLIGAAWLPWCCSATARLLSRPSFRFVPGLAVPLALMVLGGDPQTAYHVGLVALAGVGLHAVRRDAADDSWFQAVDWSRTVRRLGVLFSAAMLAAMLAAVQIVPTWMTLAETARWRDSSEFQQSPWERPTTDTHDELRYHFSVGPWRWPEMLIPNFAGKMFPRHARWLSAVPAEARVWSPSLYLGTIPVVLALCAIGWRRRARSLSSERLDDVDRQSDLAGRSDDVARRIENERDANDHGTRTLDTHDIETRWLTCVTLFAILAACGWFGLGWLIQELRYWLSGSPESGDALSRLGPQMGGPYWALVQALPGYELFRYPAKWWTVAACGLALLAARGWDMLGLAPCKPALRRMRLLAVMLAIVSGSGLAAVMGSTLTTWTQRLEASFAADAWLGPFDHSTAVRSLIATTILTFLSSVILLGIAWTRSHSAASERTRLGGAWGLVIVAWIAGDLVVANDWLLRWLPKESMSMQAAASFADDGRATSERIYRPITAGQFPATWRTISSDRRLVETHEWERAGRYGKLPLLNGESVVSHDDAWGGNDWRVLLDFGVRHGTRNSDGTVEPPDALLDLLSVRHSADQGGVQRSPAFPNAWLVSSIELVDDDNFDFKTDSDRRLTRLMMPHGKWRNFRTSAAVETRTRSHRDDASDSELRQFARDVRLEQRSMASNGDGPLPCPVRRHGPSQVEIDVTTERPALLVVNDSWAPGWRAVRVATADGTPQEACVFRVNAVMRGVVVPRGAWRVEIRYEAPGLRWGAWMSLIGLTIALGGACLSSWIRHRR